MHKEIDPKVRRKEEMSENTGDFRSNKHNGFPKRTDLPTVYHQASSQSS